MRQSRFFCGPPQTPVLPQINQKNQKSSGASDVAPQEIARKERFSAQTARFRAI
jgi:hypothetical protein